ncbi:MAG TPA: hypothetical protein VGR16_13665, partial [Thermomicrobiales bacterium]|nr:hypothetical protein [Thermomicrobiales bacterium]
VYAVVTVAISLGGDGEGPFDQLEATRLMPFQRLIVLYLAGVGVHALVVSALPRPKHRMPAGLIQLGLASAIVVGFVFAPFGGLPKENQGLFPVPTTAAPSMVSLRDAVATADEIAPEGTALYVVGSALSWHLQLWAPLWTERPLRYNDWLWSWQADHAAPDYSSLDGNAFSTMTVFQTFDAPFLDQEGIGAVVVTGQTATAAADASSSLSLAADGLYRVYEVVEPSPLVTLDSGQIDDIAVERERVSASGASPGGLATIRVNWFPRWRATVNGDEVPIQRTADGYMAVAVPPGIVDVRLSYTVTALDWLARTASGLGIVAIIALLVTQARSSRPVTPRVRWRRR